MTRRIRIAATIACLTSLLLAGASGATTRSRWYDPVAQLAHQSTIACILHAESRSTRDHPNTGDTDPYQFGPWQFTTVLWNRWSWAAGVGRKSSNWFLGTSSLHAVTIPAYQATLYQQSQVFAEVARVDGLWPWTRWDGCA